MFPSNQGCDYRHHQKSLANKRECLSSRGALWIGIFLSCFFTFIIWVAHPWIPNVDFLPDLGASWYYWKLPEQTTMGRITAWGGYALHQLASWGTIYFAQKQDLSDTDALHKVNVFALASNICFVVLHFFQTAFWYDGLAQDVSIWSSLSSVALVLIGILLMENPRRGLFFGRKIGSENNIIQDATRTLRKYHGYMFSWAIIYTFWYHPMENTGGHLCGFLYSFLFLLQGSLFFTRVHHNRYWTFLLEMFVVAHGTVVSRQTNNLWPMFFFGFAAIFIVTQMYGLGLGKWFRSGCTVAYTLAVVAVYNSRGWEKLNEIFRIPMIDYLSVYVFALIIWSASRLIGMFTQESKRALSVREKRT